MNTKTKLTREQLLEKCVDFQEDFWKKELFESFEQSSASLRKHIYHGLTGFKTLPNTVLIDFLNKYYSPQQFEIIEDENNMHSL